MKRTFVVMGWVVVSLLAGCLDRTPGGLSGQVGGDGAAADAAADVAADVAQDVGLDVAVELPLPDIGPIPGEGVRRILGGTFDRLALVTLDGRVRAHGGFSIPYQLTGPVAGDDGYVPGLDDVWSVALGDGHGCALRGDPAGGGTVWCWGFNNEGQLGSSNVSEALVSTPIQVPALDDVVDIAVGRELSCAVRADGAVWCWGADYWGQLAGRGNGAYTATPTRIEGVVDATRVAAGGDHACALIADGGVWCWGRNVFGVLGRDIAHGEPEYAGAAPVEGLDAPVIDIAASQHHTWALTASGDLLHWGVLSSPHFDKLPTFKRSLPGAVRLAPFNPTCALTADGGVTCWGPNHWGIHGDGTANGYADGPSTVQGLSAVVGVATNATYGACAVTAERRTFCWGGQNSEAAGLDDNVSVAEASDVLLAETLEAAATSVAVGGHHRCSVLDDGGVACWGRNLDGQLGDGTFEYADVPVRVATLTDTVQVAAGGAFGCALDTTGTARCWGDNRDGQLGVDSDAEVVSTPQAVVGGHVFVRLAAAGASVCALDDAGTVWCWGDNAGGQLGDGTTTARRSPVMVGGLAPATGLWVSSGAACALTDASELWCWGDNLERFGLRLSDEELTARLQAGVPYSEVRRTPEPLQTGLQGAITDVAVLAKHICVVADGTLACVRGGFEGPESVGPVGLTVSALSAATSADALVLDADGAVVRVTPDDATVLGQAGALAVEGTRFSGCTLFDGGLVRCWGSYRGADQEIQPTPIHVLFP